LLLSLFLLLSCLFSIRDDKIGTISIKLQFNNDKAWTRALKYMLINLKFLAGWSFTKMMGRRPG